MSLTKVTHSMIENSVFDVVNYGADPTGVADSKAAIQAAIDAAAASGGTVYIPPGQYKLNSGLTVGGCITLQSPSDNARAYLKITGNFTALTFPDAASGSIVEGITVDADQKNTSEPLVSFAGTNYTISNCWFLYSAFHAVRVGTAATPVIATRFYNNRVIGSAAAITNSGSGFDFSQNVNTTSTHFYSNYVSTFEIGIHSIYNIHGGGFGNIIEGCSTGLQPQNRHQVWVDNYFEANTVQDVWIGQSGAIIIGMSLGQTINFQNSIASENSIVLRDGAAQFGHNGLATNSATIQFGSSTANTLDTFEEGTWTVTETNGGSVQTAYGPGRYVRTGNQVNAYFAIRMSASASSNVLKLSLPFTATNYASATGSEGGVTIQYPISGVLTGNVVSNTATIQFLKSGPTDVTQADVSNAYIYVSVSYMAA